MEEGGDEGRGERGKKGGGGRREEGGGRREGGITKQGK
mgnify:CR=1 FL=1